MAKTSKIILELNPDQLKAYNEFSEDKGKSLEKKLAATFRNLYEQAVPEPVRRFVALNTEVEQPVVTGRSRKLKTEENPAKAPVIKGQSM